MSNDFTATDEIRTVDRVWKDNDGTWIVKCPHCSTWVGLPDGPIRGEQFQHRKNHFTGCDGWLEVSHDAKVVLPTGVVAQLSEIAVAQTDSKEHIYGMLDEIGDQVEDSQSATATVNIHKVVGTDSMTVTVTLVLKDK